LLFIILFFSNEIENYFYINQTIKTLNKEGDLLVVQRYYENVFLFSERYFPSSNFDEYFKELLKEELGKSITEGLRERISREEGIIPEISFTFALPNTFKYFVGEGGKVTVKGFQSVSFEYSLVKDEGLTGKQSGYSQFKPEQQLFINIDGNVGDKIHINVDHDSKRVDEADNKIKVWYESKDEDDILQYLSLGDMEFKGDLGINARGTLGNTNFDFALKRETNEEVSKSVEKTATYDSIILYDDEYARDKYYFLPLDNNDSLINLKVFVQNVDIYNSIPAKYFKINSPDFKNVSRFKEQLPSIDYFLNYFIFPNGKRIPFLEISNFTNGMIGICLIKKNIITGEIDTIGRYPSSYNDTTEILLIREFDPNPQDTTWYFMMRNIYEFNGGPDVQNVDVQIFKVISGGDPTNIDNITNKTYLQLLGLDNDTNSKIDQSFYNTYKGILFFPDFYPFLSPSLNSDTVPAIYRNKVVEPDKKHKYFIQIKIKRSSSEIQVERDIVENSEVIIVGNDTLKRDKDYSINYSTGTIQLLHPENYVNNEKIKISYKIRPLLGNEKYNTNLTLNTNILNSNLKTTFNFNAIPSREFYTQLGEEPSNLFISSAVFSTSQKLSFLQPITSRMPFVGSENEPNFNLSADFSFSNPDPSTKGKGYIDNMEQTVKTEGFGNSRTDWHPISLPLNKDIQVAGRTYWWNIPINLRKEIQPNRPEDDIDFGLQILFIPRNNEMGSFGGIMRSFGSSSIDISNEEAIEFWVNCDKGVLHIDIGSEICEDIYRIKKDGTIVPPNGILDTEDKNGNRVFEDKEDNGFDGIMYGDENPDAILKGDDGDDDFIELPRSFQDSLKLNGTEKNKKMDTEDLFPDNALELNNNYYTFTIDLSKDNFVVIDNRNGWRKFRIPLDSVNYSVVGNPNLTNIKYVRLWIDNVDDTLRLKIYNAGIIGNTWRNEGVSAKDSSNIEDFEKFTISYVSEYEDRNYISPVPRERITTGGYVEEKSLLFSIDSLMKNHYVMAKQIFLQPKDLRLYKKINYFSFIKEANTESVRIFLKIGTDTLNYYEIRKTLKRGDWDSISIDLDYLTSLKLSVEKDSDYLIVGNPTLKSIYFLALGVENLNDEPLSGIFYFDDIYLSSPRRSMDIKYSYRLNLDLGGISVNYTEENRGLNYKGSSGELRSFNESSLFSRNFGLKTSLDKFSFNILSLPLNLSIGSTKGTPYYYLNSDIPLPDSLRERESSNSKSYNITYSINSKSKLKNFFGYIIDPFSMSGSIRQNESFEPYRSIDTTFSFTSQLSYNLNLPKIKLLFLSLPSNFNFSSAFTKSEPTRFNYNSQESIYVKQNIKPTDEINGTFSTSYNPLSIISLGYSSSLSLDRYYSNNIYPYGWPSNFKESFNANVNIFNFTIRYSVSYDENHSYEYSKSLGDTNNVRGGGIRRDFSVGGLMNVGFLKNIPILNRIIKNLDKINTKFSIDRTSSYSYLKGRPDYRFRYGLRTYVEEDVIYMRNVNDGGDQTILGEASTNFAILGLNMDLSTRFEHRMPYRENDFSKTYSFTLPSVTINGSIPQNFIILKNLINSINYSLILSNKEDINKKTNEPDYSLKTRTINLTPTFRINFRNQISLNINGSYGNIRREEKSLLINTINSENNWSIGFTTQYTFTQYNPINLPFRKAPVKLKGNLNLSLENTISGRKLVSENLINQLRSVNSDYYDINFKLSGVYNFTSSIDGGLSINYTRHFNHIQTNDRRYSVGGSVNIKFKF